MDYEQSARAKVRSGPRHAVRKRDDKVQGTKGKPSKTSQKAMLSRALQKANTAVQLDNAQNVGSARIAYMDACDLLQQVLQKTSSEEDKQKLEAIVGSPTFLYPSPIECPAVAANY